MDCRAVKVVAGEHTASCFINTDLQDNQITAFYPGAMTQARSISLPEAGVGRDDLVLIAPNDPAAMNRAVAECTEAGIPYLYDPSMQLPRLERDDLEKGCRGARILAGNDYEFGMMAEKLGMAEAELRRMVPITVMTRGEAGSLITVGDEEFEIPAAKCKKVVDPTGAGDAFRSGFVLGYKRELPWPVVGRLAALTAVYAVEQHGPQQHSYTLARVPRPIPRELRLVIGNRRSDRRPNVGVLIARPFRLAETGQARDPIGRSDRPIGWLDQGHDRGRRYRCLDACDHRRRSDRRRSRSVSSWRSGTGRATTACVQIINEGDEPMEGVVASYAGTSVNLGPLAPAKRRKVWFTAAGRRAAQARIHAEGQPAEGVPGRRLRPDGASSRRLHGWSWSSRPIRSSDYVEEDDSVKSAPRMLERLMEWIRAELRSVNADGEGSEPTRPFATDARDHPDLHRDRDSRAARARARPAANDPRARASGMPMGHDGSPFHMTLAFLGDVRNRDLNEPARAVASTVEPFEPFRTAARGPGGLPVPGAAESHLGRALGAEPDASSATSEKRSSPPRRKPAIPAPMTRFHPHVTLGRFKSDRRGPCDLTAIVMERYRSWSCGDFTARRGRRLRLEARREAGPSLRAAEPSSARGQEIRVFALTRAGRDASIVFLRT